MQADIESMLRQLVDDDLPGLGVSIARSDDRWSVQQHYVGLDEDYPTDVYGNGDDLADALAQAVESREIEHSPEFYDIPVHASDAIEIGQIIAIPPPNTEFIRSVWERALREAEARERSALERVTSVEIIGSLDSDEFTR